MALVFALNSWAILAVSRASDGMATIWSANAILLFAVMGKPFRQAFPYYLGAGLASLLANAQAGFAAPLVIAYSVANLFEAAFAAWAFARLSDPESERFAPANLARFVGVAVAATSLSATISVLPDLAASAWFSWLVSDLLGMVLLVPSLHIICETVGGTKRRAGGGRSGWHQLGAYLLVFAVAMAVFAQAQPVLLCVVAIPVLVAVFAAGRMGAVLSAMLVAVIAVVATYFGIGPMAYAALGSFEQISLLQLFLACQLLLTLPVASLLDQRARAAADALEREKELRELAEAARRQAQRANRSMAVALARDELTGLCTRARIIQKLDQLVARAGERNQAFTLALFDIDHFKAVNDRFGHAVGDQVLQAVGEIARTAMPRRFELGRIGGEEFMLLLPGQSMDTASGYAEQLRLAIMAGSTQRSPCQVTISIGLVEWTAGATAKSMIDAADLALYRAKAAGRNQSKRAA